MLLGMEKVVFREIIPRKIKYFLDNLANIITFAIRFWRCAVNVGHCR